MQFFVGAVKKVEENALFFPSIKGARSQIDFAILRSESNWFMDWLCSFSFCNGKSYRKEFGGEGSQ